METRETRSAPDFYVRTREVHFLCMPLRHVHSELERKGAEIEACTWEGASLSVLCGCTEWLTESDPPISLGWDWELRPSGQMWLNRHSIRSSLMLIDDEGADLGLALSVAAVMRRIEALDWQAAVLSALQKPPSLPPSTREASDTDA